MKILSDKYKKWTSLLGGFLLSFVFGSAMTFSNMTPYIISYIRNSDLDTELRYSKSLWLGITNTLALKSASLLTGFLFSSKSFKINLKAYIFLGCALFRFNSLFHKTKSVYLFGEIIINFSKPSSAQAQL